MDHYYKAIAALRDQCDVLRDIAEDSFAEECLSHEYKVLNACFTRLSHLVRVRDGRDSHNISFE